MEMNKVDSFVAGHPEKVEEKSVKKNAK